MTATPAQRAKLARRIATAPLMPTEHQEQVAVFEWAELNMKRYRELRWMFAIPNAGKRHVAHAVKMRDEGLKPGVPDIFLPARRGVYGGLFIELKRRRGGTVSVEQHDWIDMLWELGYRAEVCRGADAAIAAIESYLRG